MMEIILLPQSLNIFFDQFLLPLMSHIDEGIFYFDPNGCFIVDIHVLFSWFFDLKKRSLLSAFSIPYHPDEFTKLEIKDACFFSEFSGSGFF